MPLQRKPTSPAYTPEESLAKKEAAFADMWEYYRDTYGYKPRHFKIEFMSLGDILEEIEEIDRYRETDAYKRQREDEDEEMRYYDMLDKYEQEDYEQEVQPHEDDFFDTMDFSKDKAKLRNKPVVREQRGGAVVLDTGDESSAPVVDPASFDEEESDEEFADRIAYTKKLTNDDPYRDVKPPFDYDSAYESDESEDEFAGSTEEKFFSVKPPPRNPAKSLPLTDDDPYADFDSFDDYKKDRDSKMKTEVKKVTKSGLQKLVQKLVKEQIGVEQEDPGLLIDSIEEDLNSVSAELGDTIKQLQSKQAYVSVMIRALDSTEFGGSTDMSGGGMSNPGVSLDKGADALKDLFAEYGYKDLSARIKKFLEMTYYGY